MRTFLALDLPEAVKGAIAAVQDDLPTGRIVPPENLHLTLAFLDDQPEDILQSVHEALERLDMADFPVELSGLGVFGKAQPSLLFAGLADPDPVTRLHRRVLAALRAGGLILPRRRFRPHVTLARFGGRMTADELARLHVSIGRSIGFRAGPFPARAVTFYRSDLHRDGSVYTEIMRYPLRADRSVNY